MQAALGVLGPDGLVGGVVFSNHQPLKDITITVASVDPMVCGRPRVLARCLAYPFVKLRVQRVTCEIEAGNTRSLRNARLLGFVEEGRKRGTDVVVMGLLAEEFPFRRLMAGIYDENPISARADAA
jgi:hypothetical protein